MSTQPSPLEQLAAMGQQQPTPSQPASDLSPLEQLAQQQKPQEAAQPSAEIQPVTTSTNPKLAAAESAKDMPEYVGATGALAAGAMGAQTLVAAAPLLRAIAPHLPDLDKAWKIAVGLGGASATVDHLLHVLGVLHGKGK